MGEYISREAVEQVLRGIANGLSVGETEALKAKGLKALYKMQGAKEILNAIDNDLSFIPAADVQPISHGQWIGINEYCKKNGYIPSGMGIYYWCSECEKEEPKISDYCPNCGARMDGDTND